MWLINVETKLLEQFHGAPKTIPRYAILSHTWLEGQEIIFQDMWSDPKADERMGWEKIDMTCRMAAKDGLKYAWVDTCCIDKSSSAELTEAINSMFNWYRRSAKCYAHLCDLESIPGFHSDQAEALRSCRWFTRGWTLQELIAPKDVVFYTRDWEPCFSKSDYSDQLSILTNISVDILNHTRELSTVSVAQRMSWAASRETTRVEDAAYCLLGIFDINMPLLYGEEGKAFARLQEEIIRTCPDPSIFAWKQPPLPGPPQATQDSFIGVLAPSPEYFSVSGEMAKVSGRHIPDFSMSNRGIKVRAKFSLRAYDGAQGDVAVGLILPVSILRGVMLGIQVRNVGYGSFVRQDPAKLVGLHRSESETTLVFDPFLEARLPASNGIMGMDYILAPRRHALKIGLEADMSVYRRWPWQNWDDVDAIFFGQDDPNMNWAAVKIEIGIPPEFENYFHEYIIFLFYVFGWDKSPQSKPICGMQQVSGTLPDRQLEDMNDRAVAEDWDGYWVANRLRMGHIRQCSMINVSSADGCTLLLNYTMKMVEDTNFSPCPFWKAEFF